jgi:hypothetical protein
MNAGWIVLAVAIVGAFAKRMAWLREYRESDLGSVSQQWLAEHRLSQVSDPQR